MGYDKTLILALDGAEPKLLRKFNCKNIMMRDYPTAMWGYTDISDFKWAQSIHLWASFITRRNMEKQLKNLQYSLGLDKERILEDIEKWEKTDPSPKWTLLKKVMTSDKLRILEKALKHSPHFIGLTIERGVFGGSTSKLSELSYLRKYFRELIWDVSLNYDQSFLKFYKNPFDIDYPTLPSRKREKHRQMRLDMGLAINASETTINNFNKKVWDHHFENEMELKGALKKDYDCILFFTPLIDYLSHMNFGIDEIMENAYGYADEMVGWLFDEFDGNFFIVSDHGFEHEYFERNGQQIMDRHGTHINLKYGFYAMNRSISKLNNRYQEVFSMKRNLPQMMKINRQLGRYKVRTSLTRLERSKPKITDFYSLIGLYGTRL